MGLRSWFRRERERPNAPRRAAAHTEPPLLPDGSAGHVIVTWKYEDDVEGEPIGPVWVARFADSTSPEPASEVEWEEWLRKSEARDFAASRGYAFEEG